MNSTYKGSGGVQLNNFLVKAAFAVRFGDFNLLISSLVTSHSRLMFVRDITQMAQKAAPFLSYDSDPYPVLSDGQIYWVLDAYTTSDNYPYPQNVNTANLPSNSGLNQNLNYVRNSVKVVVNAYSGQMTFYDVTGLTHTKDPILQTWEKVFPGMFTPVSTMPAALRAHLRYPEDLLNVQTATYGRYHITQPLAFYSATNAWNVSPSAGSGSPNQALPTTFTTNAQGAIVSTGQIARMAPIYELFQVPGQSTQTFNLVDAFVPVSQGDQIQTMSAFMVAGSDPSQYGKLSVFQTPPIDGPALVDADIAATQKISSQISLLNQNGSSVEFGTLQFVPVGDSMLYFRPFYVQSSRNPFPKLDYYVVVYSGRAGAEPGRLRHDADRGAPGPLPGVAADAGHRTDCADVTDRAAHLGEPTCAEPDHPGQPGLPAGSDRSQGRELRGLRHRRHHTPGRAPAAAAGHREHAELGEVVDLLVVVDHDEHDRSGRGRAAGHRSRVEPVTGSNRSEPGGSLLTTTRGGAVW